MKDHISLEDDLNCKLGRAISSLPKYEFDSSQFVSLLEQHTLLFKEVNSTRLVTDSNHYASCSKIFVFDASLFVLLIENGNSPSVKLTLKRSFGRLSLLKINGKLRNIQSKKEYRSIILAFMQLVLQAVDLFDGDSKIINDLSQIIDGFIDPRNKETMVHSSELGVSNVSSSKLLDEHSNEFQVDSGSEILQDKPFIKEIPLSDKKPFTHLSTNLSSNYVFWTHLSRDASPIPLCFVCKVDDVDKGDLQCCGKKYRPTKKCTTFFHISCLQKYNAGRFSADYLKSLVGQYQCPLHHCDTCWMDRQKSSAVHINSSIVECTGCFRGYHLECLPAGLDIKVFGKEKTTLCHSHSSQKFEKLNSRTSIPFCIECEVRDVGLKQCSKCIRSFHADCLTVRVIKGDRFRQNEIVCESCIYGESVKAGQQVIARYGTGLFPGVAVHNSEYPKHCFDADKYGKYLGHPGFIPVKWGGCQNLFSLTPANLIFPMFEGSHSLCRPKNKDKDFSIYWKEVETRLKAIKPSFNIVEEQYKKIETSTYHQDTPLPRLTSHEVDVYLCDCADDDENRCGPGSNCSARSCQHECPQICEKNGRKCNNRSVANKSKNPNMEKRGAQGKGHGVFATGIIKKGEFIAEYAGELISNEEQQRRIALTSNAQNDEEKHYMMKLDSARIIDCKFKGNIARFINHSCDPNCIVETVDVEVSSNGKTVKYDKRVRIVAVRDILTEEELSFNYDMDEFSAGCALPECLCNAPNCTGKLGRTSSKKAVSTRKGSTFTGQDAENIQSDSSSRREAQIRSNGLHPDQSHVREETESIKEEILNKSAEICKRKFSETLEGVDFSDAKENAKSSLISVSETYLRRTKRSRKVQ